MNVQDEKVKESMGREEVEKERLQNQVQSLVHDNLKLQVQIEGWVYLLVCTHEVIDKCT